MIEEHQVQEEAKEDVYVKIQKPIQESVAMVVIRLKVLAI